MYGGADRINVRVRGIDPSFLSKIENCQSGRLLGHCCAPLPAIHRGERHAKPLRKLRLRKVQIGSNGPENWLDGLNICYICHICSITNLFRKVKRKRKKIDIESFSLANRMPKEESPMPVSEHPSSENPFVAPARSSRGWRGSRHCAQRQADCAPCASPTPGEAAIWLVEGPDSARRQFFRSAPGRRIVCLRGLIIASHEKVAQAFSAKTQRTHLRTGPRH